MLWGQVSGEGEMMSYILVIMQRRVLYIGNGDMATGGVGGRAVAPAGRFRETRILPVLQSAPKFLAYTLKHLSS